MHTKPPRLYPHAGIFIDDTHEALFDLENMLLRHGTVVEGNVGQGVGKFGASTSRAKTSPTVDPVRYLHST